MKHFGIINFILLFALPCAASFAQTQEEARAAWQVTRFDVAAGVAGNAIADRALTARASITARNVGQGSGRTFTARLNPTAEVKSASVGNAQARFISRPDPRTKLQQVTVTLDSPVAPGGTVVVLFDYRLPIGDNSGLAAISAEGAQFLPAAHWYPSPNTEFAPRGADFAPVLLTVNTTGGEMVVSSGQSEGPSFKGTLNTQPFFLTGKWDVVEGTGEGRGVSAWLVAGASADERHQGEALIALAAAARKFYAELIGAVPDVPVRVVAARRGAGFEMGGTLLVDASVFRRSKIDSLTALQIAETIARLWVGGATAVQGEGAAVVREGLSRYLATLFLEKQFGREVADAERMRMARLYLPIAKRDGPLSQSTPFFDTHYNSVTNKGAMVWRLVAERAVNRDAFTAMLKREFASRPDGQTSLAAIRAALGERGSQSLQSILQGIFDQPTDTDLLIGAPQQRGGEWVVALRNTGGIGVDAAVVATTESGERLTTKATIPARDFTEARFKTPARVVRVEIDPDKFYPQTDYANDIAPRPASSEDALAEATRSFAQQQYAQTVQTARAELMRATSNQEARILLARALVEQNNLGEAEKEFRAALAAALPSPATLAWANVGLGEIALRQSKAAEAAKRFDEAVRVDADYASALAARAGRIKAEAAAGAAPAVDESARAFIAQFDQAVQSGRKASLDALIMPGELAGFVRGIVGNQPEAWQTRVLRTEAHGANRMLADVSVTARTLGRDQAGTAVLVLARAGQSWRLADIQFFEVR